MKAYTKDIIKTIVKGKKRFFALMLIAALGVCMMAGLKASCDDLRYSADAFFDEQNLFDIQIVSTYGLTDEDVETLRRIAGVETVEGAYSEKVYIQVDGLTKQAEVKVLSQKGINEPYVLEGELPMRADEIVVTQKYINQTGAKIGDTIVIEEQFDEVDDSEEEDETEEDEESPFDLELEEKYEKDDSEETDEEDYKIEVEEDEEEPNFLVTEYTIVGVVIDAEDINSAEGAVAFRNNNVTDYTFFILPDAVSSDVYTAVYITLVGTDELFCFSDEYEARVEEIITVLEEEIKVDREQARYEEIQKEATEKVDDAEDEMNDKFDDAEGDLLDAKLDIEDGWSELLEGEWDLLEGEKELAAAERKLEAAERELNKAERQLADAKAQLDAAEAELEAGEAAIEEGEEAIEEGRKELQEAEAELEGAEEEVSAQFETTRSILKAEIISVKRNITQTEAEITILNAEIEELEGRKNADANAWSDIDEAKLQAKIAERDQKIDDLDVYEEQLDAYETALEDTYEQEEDALESIAEARQEIADGYAELDEAEAELEDAKKELEEGRKDFEEAKADYEEARKEVDDGWEELENGWEELEEAYEDYYEGRREYEEGKAELEDGIAEYEEGVSEYEDKKSEAQDKIAEARQEIADLKMTEWYVNSRTTLGGYSNIQTDAACIESIGDAFPILFMTVAILISLTTISRMVEEDRGLIGTYKALGFTDKEIRRKYVIYALLACVLGGILGDFLGFVVLPEIIFTVFGVMYQLPTYTLAFNWFYGLGGIILFMVGIVGAAYISCNAELKIMPAMLMRPKAPKNGSRVLLERITPIWSRLSFLNKVTARNLFRYKKRLFMTLFGIAGCTSILLAGFTIKDTITALMSLQYETTYNYDVMVVSDDGEQLEEYLEDAGVRSYINPMITNITVINKNGDEESVQLIVVPEGQSLRGYINLYNKQEERLTLTDGMIASTINVANVLGYTEGDVVTLQTMDLESMEVEVTDVVLNYLGNAIYMTENTYCEIFDDYETNGAFVLLNDSIKDHEAYATELGMKDGILTAISVAGFQSNFDNVFRIINLVVTIVITLAAALAFVVLFTLSTTNISERERELATIKVLGFFDREVHLYVNKETLILTSLGILLGMPIGKVFGAWLMSVLNMPSIYFAAHLYGISYLYAAIISICFAFIVNFITDKSLDKINPVEALKSIE